MLKDLASAVAIIAFMTAAAFIAMMAMRAPLPV